MKKTIALTSGLKVSGVLSGSEKQKLIILCHGYKSSGFTPVMKKLSAGLNKLGYATYAFDFPKQAETDIEHQVDIILQIVSHFPKRQKKILMGASLGVIAASIAAIEDPGVAGLITVNGFFGEHQIGPEFKRDFRIFRLLSLFVPKIRRTWHYFKKHLKAEDLRAPALVIHSKSDVVIPISQSEKFYENIIAPKHFVALDDVFHGLKGKHDVEAVLMAVDPWMKTI
jgi:alpha-beta hydrolase superfamily lysophospholipase